jgi:hypothetical protein
MLSLFQFTLLSIYIFIYTEILSLCVRLQAYFMLCEFIPRLAPYAY